MKDVFPPSQLEEPLGQWTCFLVCIDIPKPDVERARCSQNQYDTVPVCLTETWSQYINTRRPQPAPRQEAETASRGGASTVRPSLPWGLAVASTVFVHSFCCVRKRRGRLHVATSALFPAMGFECDF